MIYIHTHLQENFRQLGRGHCMNLWVQVLKISNVSHIISFIVPTSQSRPAAVVWSMNISPDFNAQLALLLGCVFFLLYIHFRCVVGEALISLWTTSAPLTIVSFCHLHIYAAPNQDPALNYQVIKTAGNYYYYYYYFNR